MLGGGWFSTAKPPGDGTKAASGRIIPFSLALAAVGQPADTFEVACCTNYGKDPNVEDTPDGFDALYPPDWAKGQPYWGDISGRHVGGANVLFVDGHVRWQRRENAFTMPMFGL